jgi:uncharacterized protein YbjT (DUF2867 family)
MSKKVVAIAGATGAQGGGLARAILSDSNGEFTVRALTRNRNSEKARALADLGAEWWKPTSMKCPASEKLSKARTAPIA